MLAFIYFFFQNRFLNECAIKSLIKILRGQVFFVRCSRTYVINKFLVYALFVELIGLRFIKYPCIVSVKFIK